MSYIDIVELNKILTENYFDDNVHSTIARIIAEIKTSALLNYSLQPYTANSFVINNSYTGQQSLPICTQEAIDEYASETNMYNDFNLLRKLSPNFRYTYFVDKVNKQVFVENIASVNDITLNEFLLSLQGKKLSDNDLRTIASIIAQLGLSFQMLALKRGAERYDIDLNQIILRAVRQEELGTRGKVKYTIGTLEYYVNVYNFIATFTTLKPLSSKANFSNFVFLLSKIRQVLTKTSLSAITCKETEFVGQEIFKLQGPQKNALSRFVEKCFHQRGFLVLHTMGSGKTGIGVAYIANFEPRYKKVIITPPGIDTAWREDFRNFNLSKEQRCSVIFLTYSDLESKTASELFELFLHSIVVADEAHILVKILRGSNRAAVRNALKVVDRVLLLTGTPIQGGWGDLGVLINICKGPSPKGELFLPGSEKQFIEAFQQSKTVSKFNREVIGAVDTVMSYFTSTLGQIASLTGVAGLYSYTGGYTVPIITAGALAVSYGIEKLLWETKQTQLRSISESAVVQKIKNFVSFFDYKFLDPFDNNLMNYPAIFQNTVNMKTVSLSEFQLKQKVINNFNLYNQTTLELEVYNDIDIDRSFLDTTYTTDFTGASVRTDLDPDEFYARMRVLGNLSPALMFYMPQRILSDYNQLFAKTLSAAGNRHYYAQRRPFNSELNDKYVNDFALIRNILRGIRTSLYKENASLLTDEKLDFEDMFYCTKFENALDILGEARRAHHYLPVVYSNFDENGFQLFSAYLTSKNLPHIVIHPNDKSEVRQRLVKIANLPHRKYDYRQVEGSQYRYVPRAWISGGANLDDLNLPMATPLEDQVDEKYLQNLAEEKTKYLAIQQTAGTVEAAAAKKQIDQITEQMNKTTTQMLLRKRKTEEKLEELKVVKFVSKQDYRDVFRVSNSDPKQRVLYLQASDLKGQNMEYEKILRFKSHAAENDAARISYLLSVQYNDKPDTVVRNVGYDIENGEVPFCVLLHPGIREGIGFDLAPCMVCLEVPQGVGNRDQIYARVLRSVNARKRTCSYVDNTFLPGYFSHKPSDVPKNQGLLPWRVTKQMHQMMLGTAPSLYHIPQGLRNLFPSLPKYGTMPDLWKTLNFSNDYFVMNEKQRELFAKKEQLKQRTQADLQEIERLQREALFSIPGIEQKNIFWAQRFSIVLQGTNKILTKEQLMLALGPTGMSKWKILNCILHPTVPNFAEIGLSILRFISPDYFTQSEAYKQAQEQGYEFMSYLRFLRDKKYSSTQTGDEYVFNMNVKTQEQVDRFNENMNKIKDDSDPVLCELDAIAVDPCEQWVPDTESQQRIQTVANSNSCYNVSTQAYSKETALNYNVIKALEPLPEERTDSKFIRIFDDKYNVSVLKDIYFVTPLLHTDTKSGDKIICCPPDVQMSEQQYYSQVVQPLSTAIPAAAAATSAIPPSFALEYVSPAPIDGQAVVPAAQLTKEPTTRKGPL